MSARVIDEGPGAITAAVRRGFGAHARFRVDIPQLLQLRSTPCPMPREARVVRRIKRNKR